MPAHNLTSQDQQRLHRGVAHLHKLGPCAMSEMLATSAAQIGGGPALLAVLAEFERLRPGQVRAETSGRSQASRVLEGQPMQRNPAGASGDQTRKTHRGHPQSK